MCGALSRAHRFKQKFRYISPTAVDLWLVRSDLTAMTKIISLSQIADVRIANAARGAVPAAQAGRRRALTSGALDLLASGQVEHLSWLPDEELTGVRTLEGGDVVLLARGGLRAVAYDGPSGVIVPFSPLMVLRVKAPERADPRYLATFLNLPSTRMRAEAEMQGTSIRMLGRKEVDALNIPLPPLSRQRLIAELAELHMREEALLRGLSRARSHLLAALCAAE